MVSDDIVGPNLKLPFAQNDEFRSQQSFKLLPNDEFKARGCEIPLESYSTINSKENKQRLTWTSEKITE